MASKHTANYGLSQWEKTDKVVMEDFNGDNAKIDAALQAASRRADGLESSVAALAAEMVNKGTCVVEHFTYTGTGKYGPGNPTVVQFRKQPVAFLIYGPYTLMAGAGRSALISTTVSSVPWFLQVSLDWSGGKLSFLVNRTDISPTVQLNTTTTYYVIAFYTA